MSAASEKALQRRVVLLEKKLMILTARFEAMDKAAAIMGGSEHGSFPNAVGKLRPRPRHLRVVR